MDTTFTRTVTVVVAVALILFIGLFIVLRAYFSTSESEKVTSSQSKPKSTANRWKELNDWYINDSNNEKGTAAPIRWAYEEIGLRKPSVSDFARGCVIARLSGYIHPKPSHLSYANTVGEFGYTERDEYDIGIAYVLTELDGVRQRTWCNKIVELHNLDPWDGQPVPWP